MTFVKQSHPRADDRALASAREHLETAQRELERLSKPKLIAPHGDVMLITFSKRFRGSAKAYAYAAIRAGRLWYLTGGTSPQGLNDRQLVEFIELDNVAEIIGYEIEREREPLPF